MGYTKFEAKLSNLINAGFPYVYIPSYEEERVLRAIAAVAADPELVRSQRKLFWWSQTDGIGCSESKGPDRGTQAPLAALEHIGRYPDPAIFVLKDFHVFFGPDRQSRPDYAVIRKLRDILTNLKMSRKTVIFLSPRLVLPCDLEKDISVLEFGLPDEGEIRRMLEELTAGLNPESIRLNSEEKRALVRSALGLTLQEAENAFCRAIVQTRGLDKNAISIIYDEKNQVVRKTGVLEFVKSDLSIRDIGGLENLKKWLLKRNNTWLDRAKQYNLPAPKGVLITGVPGCGKSLTAKAMSAIWNLPLLKLDMGKIFGGIVGSSEENMRKAIATAEAVAPSILWVDEIEKGFAGTQSDGDAGTSARVFGTFLTWMQDKTAPVFVIATSNDISRLPPELLRKGRFDEIFFVDLPTTREREKIFQVHLGKRTANSQILHPAAEDGGLCSRLAALSEGFSGAEIEQAVVAGMYDAFYADRGMTAGDLERSIGETVPLSVTQREQLAALRGWAEHRAVLATAREDREIPANTEVAPRQGGRLVDFDL